MKKKTMAIGVAAALYMTAGFFAAEYIAGAVYFIANKSAPKDITTDTFSTYWKYYSDVPKQKKKLQFSAAVGIFGVYVLPALVIAQLSQKTRSLHGDARFATMSEVRKSGLLGEKGIIVGKKNGQYLMFYGQQFVLLAAPTRSGKGVAIVIPNLLNYPDSVVVLDVKKENFLLTSKFRAVHGQEVYLWNPFAEDNCTHRYNPLDYVRRHANYRVGDLLMIGEVLYPSSGKDTFWNDSARNLFLGLGLYLVETPTLPCSLGELLRQSSGKGSPIKDYLQGVIAQRIAEGNPLSDDCQDALARFINTSDNTMSSILATFNAPLTIFSNPIVDASTSASDFDLRDVRKKRMSIYVGIQPGQLAQAKLLINLFFSQLVHLNTAELPEQNPALKYQCLLILDEFTAIGRVGILAKAVSYIAGYNLRLLTIIQSMSQLESDTMYGREDARTYVTNHALQVLYPPREQKDANEYSEMLGFFTEKAVSKGHSRPSMGPRSQSENISDQRRALMLPQELKELDQSAAVITLENCKPIMAEKARYYEDAIFVDRLKKISPSLAGLGKVLPTREQLNDALFVRGELSAQVPHLDVDLHKARIESRTRPLAVDEKIDLKKLAMDVSSLPELDDPINPSPESVAAVVDGFFNNLEWYDEDAPDPDDGMYGANFMAPLDPLNDESPSAEVAQGGEIEQVMHKATSAATESAAFNSVFGMSDSPFDEPADDAGLEGPQEAPIDVSVLYAGED